jgi:hypothetical protein
MLDWILIGIQFILIAIQAVLLLKARKLPQSKYYLYSFGISGIVLILMFIITFD